VFVNVQKPPVVQAGPA